ncbi:hypothetical protein P691DRAFT_800895 [Macrolepiota fuliginosa MF-IS2]|uniref:Chromatin target of PRMT1 protein C-terminal domain-containing protein n=1 Tax=Macrolepiota fuliginosa MF-IS2 TaxID=1400762 RepID=A0A9P5XCB5_9AGAR|nr:hypothetical protein P691DRAFT_800895 [Macrolepiota fuliginosa MF-IS2]
MDVATDLVFPSTHTDTTFQGQPDDIAIPNDSLLSYDDNVAYEHQLPTLSENDDPRSGANPLKSRIGTTKVYLLEDTSAAARNAKRKYDDEGDEENQIIFDRSKRTKETSEELGDEVEMDEADLGYRANAILLQGTPISHLPTARLFAYAKHFDTAPLGLEWVNDQTCILVYPSNILARTAFTSLHKSSAAAIVTEATSVTPADADDEGLVTAKPIPITLWPPETRINSTLGVTEGLKGVIKMRWARPGDVKKKGAKRESEFYRRHGTDAGKELFNGRDLPPTKRPRLDHEHPHENGHGSGSGGRNTVMDEEMEKRRLDAELDTFLHESDSDLKPSEKPTLPSSEPEHTSTPSSPPSKMRSDYIARDGRTLLDRFSDATLFETDRNPAEAPNLKDRLTMPLPRRRQREHGGRRRGGERETEREGESSSGSLWDRLSPADVDSDSGRERRRGGSGSGGHGGRDTREVRDARRSGGRRGNDRPKKTQQELDDELEAFLKRG